MRRARLGDNFLHFVCATPASDHQVAPDTPESVPQVLHGMEREGRVQATFRGELLHATQG